MAVNGMSGNPYWQPFYLQLMYGGRHERFRGVKLPVFDYRGMRLVYGVVPVLYITASITPMPRPNEKQGVA